MLYICCNAGTDSRIVQEIIDLLSHNSIDYCVISGLAVNAYVEPVFSLDIEIVVVADDIDILLKMTQDTKTLLRMLRLKKFWDTK